MMTEIIRNLKNKENGMYESPTGSGKTLCFLISALSYLKYSYKN
jgi:Rad3-related DNA helicase